MKKRDSGRANGIGLPARARHAIARAYRMAYGLPVRWMDVRARGGPESGPFARPALQRAAFDAFDEAVRWGEPYVYFAAPGLLSWMVPLVDGDVVRGAAGGGEVLAEEADRGSVAEALAAAGMPRAAVRAYAGRLRVWPEERPREAARRLYDLVYGRTGWTPSLLDRHREAATQQRQIAETIHARKGQPGGLPRFDQERRLFSLIRIGDRRGAHRVLNELLAAQFLHAPSVPVLRARAIELMGYLVRAAVEDNPLLEPLIAENHRWLLRIVEAPDFDAIWEAQRDALDAFVQAVALQGFNRSSPSVRRALDYLAAHFREPIRLVHVARAAALSTYRLAHLVKERTGRTVLQHLQRLRLDHARTLLDEGVLNGAAIAAECGFHDQSHMTRRFRARFGVTPGRYRRGARPAATFPS